MSVSDEALATSSVLSSEPSASIPCGLAQVILSLATGTTDLDLSAAQLSELWSGLHSAAQSVSAWLTTAGVDCAISDLLGETNFTSPLIGICDALRVRGHSMLRASRGRTIRYRARTASKADEGSHLNAGHTHFILVDRAEDVTVARQATHGEEARAARKEEAEAAEAAEEAGEAEEGAGVRRGGCAVAFRVALEASLSATKRVPLVQLVVQGGPATLRSVLAMARRLHPIVLVVDSGGAAGAIAEYVTTGALAPAFFEAEPWSRVAAEPVLRMLAAIKAQHEKMEGALLKFASLGGHEQVRTEGSPLPSPIHDHP